MEMICVKKFVWHPLPIGRYTGQFPKFAADVNVPFVVPIIVPDIVLDVVHVIVPVVVHVVVPVVVHVVVPGDRPDDAAHQLLLEPQLGIDQAETNMLLHA